MKPLVTLRTASKGALAADVKEYIEVYLCVDIPL